MEPPRTSSFDGRAFWFSFAACALPFLSGLALFFTGTGNALPEVFLVVSLWGWGLAYLVCVIWMVYAFATRDLARGLAILLGMIAGAIVGPGACFGVFLSAGGPGSMQ